MSLSKLNLYTTLRTIHAVRPGSFAAFQQTRSYEIPHEVIFDQTKKNNDPKGQEDKSAKPQSSDNESHPQKQPDLQKSPSSATGIETEGPEGSKAGKGSGGD